MSCGSALAAGCPNCGAENPPGARFCTACGTSLTPGAAAASPGPAAAAPSRPAADEPPPEERRKATVLFADLSGYTAVSERLDPERIKTLVDRALRRLGEEVERYGGSI